MKSGRNFHFCDCGNAGGRGEFLSACEEEPCQFGLNEGKSRCRRRVV